MNDLNPVTDTSDAPLNAGETPHRCELSPPPLVNLEPEQLQLIAENVPGGLPNVQDVYPLTALQEGMLFQRFLQRTGDPYVVLLLLECRSESGLGGLTNALQFVIDRHDTLRTAIVWEGLPKPLQIVYRTAQLPVEHLALKPSRDCVEQMMERMRLELHRPNLSCAPLIRLQVAANPRSIGTSYVLMQVHHLICDAVSMEILISQITARIKSDSWQPPATVQFRSHVARTLERAPTLVANDFFRRMLSDFKVPTAPFGLAHDHDDSSEVQEVRQQLPPGLGPRLRTQATKSRVSAAAIFHVACALAVSRSCGLDDVVFGTVYSGRLMAGPAAQKTVGMFINTLPLRLKLGNLSAAESVSQTHRQLLELLAHEHVELGVAHRCSGVSGSTPLFSVLLNYIQRPRRQDTGWSDTDTGITQLASRAWTNYPVTFIVEDLGDEFAIVSQTRGNKKLSCMLNYLGHAVEALIDALETTPHCKVVALPLLPEASPLDSDDADFTHSAEGSAETSSQEYEPPLGATEERLAAIWAETLHVEKVGRNQSFFFLGGHSLLGFQLLMKVSAHFGVDAPTISIFRYPTVGRMAELIDSLNSQNDRPRECNQPDVEEGVI